MTTSAPKTKKQVAEPESSPSEQEQILADLAWECGRDHEIADGLLQAIVTAKRNPNFAESTFFQGRLGWDEREQQRQINRVATVLRAKAIAGSASDRLAASTEQVTSADILRVEGPKLNDAIAKLQDQKDALERNAVRAERVCEQIDAAVENLRSVELMRPDLRAKHECHRRQFAESDWTRLGAVGVEVSFRMQMLAPVEDPRKFIESLGVHFPDCRKFDLSSQRFVIENDVWEHRKKVMRIELIELQDEFDRLSALKAEQMASLEHFLDHYLEEK